jgi:uncharacterized protein DUF3606
MADDKKSVGNPDRQRINVSQDYEVRDWAKKFGVSPEELKTAVAKVGNQAADVESHLKKASSARKAN